jgi:hypothetical protein
MSLFGKFPGDSREIVTHEFVVIVIDPDHVFAATNFFAAGKFEDLRYDMHQRVILEKQSLPAGLDARRGPQDV